MDIVFTPGAVIVQTLIHNGKNIKPAFKISSTLNPAASVLSMVVVRKLFPKKYPKRARRTVPAS